MSEQQPSPSRGRRRALVEKRVPGMPDLPATTRVLLLILGWLLVAVGILGLVVPVLQGVVTLLLGAAALSLVSSTMLYWLRLLFRPWPHGWRLLLRLRRRVLRWIGAHSGDLTDFGRSTDRATEPSSKS